MNKTHDINDNQYYLMCDLAKPDGTLHYSYITHFDLANKKVTVNYPTEEFTMVPDSFEGKTVKDWVMDQLLNYEKHDPITIKFIKNNKNTKLSDVFIDHLNKNLIKTDFNIVKP